MIFTIEGVDCSGKSFLANAISKKFDIPVLEIDFKKSYKDFSTENWKNVIYGSNEMLCSVYRCLDNFVKTRFQLSEYVYSKYYKRDGFDFDTMDNCGIKKNIIVLSVISYQAYLERAQGRKDKELFTEQEFYDQQNLFKDAYDKSKVERKILYDVEKDPIDDFVQDLLFDVIF